MKVDRTTIETLHNRHHNLRNTIVNVSILMLGKKLIHKHINLNIQVCVHIHTCLLLKFSECWTTTSIDVANMKISFRLSIHAKMYEHLIGCRPNILRTRYVPLLRKCWPDKGVVMSTTHPTTVHQYTVNIHQMHK